MVAQNLNGAEFSAPPAGNPARRGAGSSTRYACRPKSRGGWAPGGSGPSLASDLGELFVFRATILSIVLTFAAGPSVSPLCRAWCDAQAAAETGCHHRNDGSSTSVSGGDACQDGVLRVAALLKENLLPRVSSDHVGVAIVARLQMMAPRSYARPATDLGRALYDQKRPLSTPLRV